MKRFSKSRQAIIFLLILNSISRINAQDTASYMSTSATVAKGRAPGMKWKLLSDNQGVKEYSLVFAKDDEVLSGILDFAEKQVVKAARFTAIGAFKKATVAWYDVERTAYKLNHINQQVEVVSLIGDIALYEGKPVGWSPIAGLRCKMVACKAAIWLKA